MITPEPTPLDGAPNGEKPLPDRPSAVIVTTVFWACAMTSVRSVVWTVVEPVLAACPGAVVAAGATLCGTRAVTARAVPPEARTADRRDTPRMAPVPGRRRVELAGRAGVVETGAAGSGACHCGGPAGADGDAGGVDAPGVENGS